ncbi:MAG: hypothetical protein K2H71_01420, partial [Muribaculaceae bacterium]|nr:hypothetical protein [Muribaculaceae bacterium]
MADAPTPIIISSCPSLITVSYRKTGRIYKSLVRKWDSGILPEIDTAHPTTWKMIETRLER